MRKELNGIQKNCKKYLYNFTFNKVSVKIIEKIYRKIYNFYKLFIHKKRWE